MFGSTWLAYATFYLGRKNYAIAQPAFMAEFGWSKDQVGFIITAFLTTYAVGQFVNGFLGDRLGSRVMLTIGFVLTALCTFVIGFGESIGFIAVAYGLNGYAQSTGWPSVTRAMTNWFTLRERGRVMGWWGTSYPLGEAFTSTFTAFVLASWGWRYAFWIPALLVLVIGGLCLTLMRDHPRDLGFSSGDDARRAPGGQTASVRRESTRGISVRESLEQVRDRRVITLGLAYFCIKFVRYTFVFWIGLYLVERLGFTPVEAGYLQVPFPLVGLVGSIVAGTISDRLFDARRAPVAALMLFFLMAALLAFPMVPKNTALVIVALSTIGFMTFGPDMLVSTVAAMDFGSQKAAATVAGFVNGMGSIGGALSGVVVGTIAERFGWSEAIYVLIGMTALAAAITLTLWNARGD